MKTRIIFAFLLTFMSISLLKANYDITTAPYVNGGDCYANFVVSIEADNGPYIIVLYDDFDNEVDRQEVSGNGEYVFEENTSEMSYYIEIYDQSECVYTSKTLMFDCECKSGVALSLSVGYQPCERFKNTVYIFNLFTGFGPLIKEVIWEDGSTEWTRNDLPVGEHCVDVTVVPNLFSVLLGEGQECTVQKCITVEDICNCPDPLVGSEIIPANCIDCSDGSIILDLRYTDEDSYTLKWDPELPEKLEINDLAAGTYNLTITDLDCTQEEYIYSFEVGYCTEDSEPLNIQSEIGVTSCDGCTDGFIALEVNSLGPINLVYEWSNGGMDNGIYDIANGTYTVTITDKNCDKNNRVLEFDVNVKECPEVNIEKPILCRDLEKFFTIISDFPIDTDMINWDYPEGKISQVTDNEIRIKNLTLDKVYEFSLEYSGECELYEFVVDLSEDFSEFEYTYTVEKGTIYNYNYDEGLVGSNCFVFNKNRRTVLHLDIDSDLYKVSWFNHKGSFIGNDIDQEFIWPGVHTLIIVDKTTGCRDIDQILVEMNEIDINIEVDFFYDCLYVLQDPGDYFFNLNVTFEPEVDFVLGTTIVYSGEINEEIQNDLPKRFQHPFQSEEGPDGFLLQFTNVDGDPEQCNFYIKSDARPFNPEIITENICSPHSDGRIEAIDNLEDSEAYIRILRDGIVLSETGILENIQESGRYIVQYYSCGNVIDNIEVFIEDNETDVVFEEIINCNQLNSIYVDLLESYTLVWPDGSTGSYYSPDEVGVICVTAIQNEFLCEKEYCYNYENIDFDINVIEVIQNRTHILPSQASKVTFKFNKNCTYIWEDTGTSYTYSGGVIEFSGLADGVYGVTAIDSDGCEIYYEFVIFSCPWDYDEFNNTQYPEISYISVKETITPPNDSPHFLGSIEIDISGGYGDMELYWIGPNGYESNDEDIFNLQLGEYCLTINDGCTNYYKCFTIEDCNLIPEPILYLDYEEGCDLETEVIVNIIAPGTRKWFFKFENNNTWHPSGTELVLSRTFNPLNLIVKSPSGCELTLYNSFFVEFDYHTYVNCQECSFILTCGGESTPTQFGEVSYHLDFSNPFINENPCVAEARCNLNGGVSCPVEGTIVHDTYTIIGKTADGKCIASVYCDFSGRREFFTFERECPCEPEINGDNIEYVSNVINPCIARIYCSENFDGQDIAYEFIGELIGDISGEPCTTPDKECYFGSLGTDISPADPIDCDWDINLSLSDCSQTSRELIVDFNVPETGVLELHFFVADDCNNGCEYNLSDAVEKIPFQANENFDEIRFKITNLQIGSGDYCVVATYMGQEKCLEITFVSCFKGPDSCEEVLAATNDNDTEFVSFQSLFDKTLPAVFTSPVSYNDPGPATTRVSGITSNGFDLKIEEWDYSDGVHGAENISFLAAEKGIYDFGGLKAEIGIIKVDSRFQTFELQTAFESPPVIITTVISNNENMTVAERVRNVGNNSFQMRLQEQVGNNVNSSHAYEQVAYIAIEKGVGRINGKKVLVGTTGNSVTHNWSSVNYPDVFESKPLVLAGMQTTDGGDVATVRYQNLTNNNISFKVEEEKSSDAEILHTTEVIGYLLIESSDKCDCKEEDLWIIDYEIQHGTCNSPNGHIIVNLEHNYPVTYEWSNGETTLDLYELGYGEYTLTVTDENGCTIEQGFEVVLKPRLGLEDLVDHPDCDMSNGSIELYPYGGVAPYTYNWDTGDNTAILSNLSEGKYKVTITDVNGCYVKETYDLRELNLSGYKIGDAVCGQDNGSILGGPQSGTPPFTYNWDTGDVVQELRDLSPGQYRLTVTDAIGCTDIRTFIVGTEESIDIYTSGGDEGFFDGKFLAAGTVLDWSFITYFVADQFEIISDAEGHLLNTGRVTEVSSCQCNNNFDCGCADVYLGDHAGQTIFLPVGEGTISDGIGTCTHGAGVSKAANISGQVTLQEDAYITFKVTGSVCGSYGTGWIVNVDCSGNSSINNITQEELMSVAMQEKHYRDISSDLFINVNPNPTEDFINLFVSNNEESYNLTLKDVTGKVLIIQQNLMESSSVLDVNEIPSGIYLLEVEMKGQKIVEKIVKQ